MILSHEGIIHLLFRKYIDNRVQNVLETKYILGYVISLN